MFLCQVAQPAGNNSRGSGDLNNNMSQLQQQQQTPSIQNIKSNS